MDRSRTQDTLDALADLFLTGLLPRSAPTGSDRAAVRPASAIAPRPSAMSSSAPEEPQETDEPVEAAPVIPPSPVQKSLAEQLEGPPPLRMLPVRRGTDEEAPRRGVPALSTFANRLLGGQRPASSEPEPRKPVKPALPVVRVEAISLGNLPGFGGPWLTQYAHGLAQQLGAVAVVHIDDEQLDLELVRPATAPSRFGQKDGAVSVQRNLAEALLELIHQEEHPARAIIVHLPDRLPPEVEALVWDLPCWGLLAGTDDTAVAAAGAWLEKALAPADAPDAHDLPHRLGLVVAGVDEPAAREICQRLNEPWTRDGQEAPLELLGHLRRMVPVHLKAVAHSPAEPAELSALGDLLKSLGRTAPQRRLQRQRPLVVATDPAPAADEESEPVFLREHPLRQAPRRPAASPPTPPPAAPRVETAPPAAVARTDGLRQFIESFGRTDKPVVPEVAGARDATTPAETALRPLSAKSARPRKPRSAPSVARQGVESGPVRTAALAPARQGPASRPLPTKGLRDLAAVAGRQEAGGQPSPAKDFWPLSTAPSQAPHTPAPAPGGAPGSGAIALGVTGSASAPAGHVPAPIGEERRSPGILATGTTPAVERPAASAWSAQWPAALPPVVSPAGIGSGESMRSSAEGGSAGQTMIFDEPLASLVPPAEMQASPVAMATPFAPPAPPPAPAPDTTPASHPAASLRSAMAVASAHAAPDSAPRVDFHPVQGSHPAAEAEPDLGAFMPGALRLQARPARHRHIQLVLDESGRLHLLLHRSSRSSGGIPRHGSPELILQAAVLELLEARQWVEDNLDIVRLTQRQCRFDAAVRPAVHLFTDDAKPACTLLTRLGDQVKLHLLERVAVGRESTWFCVALN